MSFEDYWETDGSRQDIADHKERARLAWEAGRAYGYKRGKEDEQDEQRYRDWEDACMAVSE